MTQNRERFGSSSSFSSSSSTSTSSSAATPAAELVRAQQHGGRRKRSLSTTSLQRQGSGGSGSGSAASRLFENLAGSGRQRSGSGNKPALDPRSTSTTVWTSPAILLGCTQWRGMLSDDSQLMLLFYMQAGPPPIVSSALVKLQKVHSLSVLSCPWLIC